MQDVLGDLEWRHHLVVQGGGMPVFWEHYLLQDLELLLDIHQVDQVDPQDLPLEILEELD